MQVRPFHPDDAPALAELYGRSVRELGDRDYSPEQVAASAGLAPAPQQLIDLMDGGRARWVAADAEDRPLAFADPEADGRIRLSRLRRSQQAVM
jgi:putative acetyltransferase